MFLQYLDTLYHETMSALKSCEVGFNNPPPIAQIVVSVNDVPLDTQGNLLCITGGEETGKSNYVASVIFGAIRQQGSDIDTLGITINENIHQKAMLFYDTEQSEVQLYSNMTKKKEKKTIFNALTENDVCFAVCIASSSFISREVAAFSKDYFVIINKCDEKRVKEVTFYSTEGYKQVCERNLSTDEIEEFRSNKDKFVKVRNNEYGRVYELKGQSFKVAYDSLRKKLSCKVIWSNECKSE